MKTIELTREMQKYSDSSRSKGKKIAFVPTMGYFHEGHIELMRQAKKMADCVVVSIYVNPTQFGPKEDLSRYPRDFDRDSERAKEVGVDVIFYPSNKEMYPEGYQTYVNVEDVTKNLCGLSRPGHFCGVTTVCAKLFNIVKPHIAVFGKKDYQQYVTIKRMVADLNMDLEIIGLPTVREADGLAMSSRNVYLKENERPSALTLIDSLRLAQKLYDQGERKASTIISQVEKFISQSPYTDIDYVKICDPETMRDIEKIRDSALIALAVKVAQTRLIDNHAFGELI
ncbi:MAG: pantoate--beta-alanine ligase [Syntrophaceae bacterium]|nr:pantoate--beta-alanine ligase [Syntrophaceae bacterium]